MQCLQSHLHSTCIMYCFIWWLVAVWLFILYSQLLDSIATLELVSVGPGVHNRSSYCIYNLQL